MMADESRIALLLDELFDDRLTPEEACRDHPELLDEVRKQWQRMCAVQAKLEARFPSPGADAEKMSPVHEPAANLPQIAGYDVECVLGHGGMGVVYRARHLKLDRTVAVKMLLTGMYAGPQELARFLGEAKAVAGLRHPNIVQVYDVGDVKGRPYFTMEFLEGGNLAQKLGGQPQPAGEVSETAIALAEAMQIAHRNGIVHRDLKPANILLTADGTPKIADFGLARRFESDEHLTVTGARIGTLSYMAPEQAVGKPGLVGPAVDIYSMGAVLYELLAGRPPFRAATPQETERQLLTEEPVPPRRLNSSVPRDLETICLKCLHKNPNRRYESAEALTADIRRFVRGEPITARPASFGERSSRWVLRRRGLVATLSVALLLLLAALAGTIWFIAEQKTNRRAVEVDLQEARNLQRLSNWTEAHTALERARTRLGDHGFEDLKRVLDLAERDQAAAARLEKIRSDQTITEDGIIPVLRLRSEYEAVFRDLGLGGRDDDPALVASRIRRSNIRAILVSAAEAWADITEDGGHLNWLLQVARQATPDPTGWREQALTFTVWTNKSDLGRLIASATVTESSVPLLVALGERYERQGGNSVDLLIKCQRVCPHDFWANFWLGQALRTHGNPGESLRYFQAAVAIRRDSGAGYHWLGTALYDLKRFDDSIEAFETGLRVEPQSSADVNNLSLLLSFKGRHKEAIQKLQNALDQRPNNARFHFYLGVCLNAGGQKEEALKHVRQGSELDPAEFAHLSLLRTLWLRHGGEGEEIRKLWRTALGTNPPKHDAWDGYAELSLYLGRDDEYRWARQELLKRFGKTSDPYIADRTGRACLFMPGTDEELQNAAELIGTAISADRTKVESWAPFYFSFAQGFLAYRQGRFQESAAIVKGDAGRVLGPARGLVLAMAQFQLGQTHEAQASLEKAVKSFDWEPSKADAREAWMYHILRREAEALIK